MKKPALYSFVVCLVGLIMVSCNGQKEKEIEIESEVNLKMEVKKVAQIEDQEVFSYLLDNGWMKVEMSNYGGLISRIWVPDSRGNLENIALTLDNVEDYLTKPNPFFGATAGRVANRIAGGRFELNGQTYQLPQNNGENTLHGGLEGFNKKVWTSEPYSNDSIIGVKMTYLSEDGEEGFPGNLSTTLWMELTMDNEIRIRFESETDQPTIVNLTNHTYFNLGGMKRDAQDHLFQFNADYYTPVDNALIPTGEIKDVTGTPFDFRESKKLSDQIASNEGGFDHNMIMKLKSNDEMIHFTTVSEPASGRVMKMYSDESGVQFYTGNFLNDFAGADGITYGKHWGFCLESQNWPDAINHDNFPSPILNPGEKYQHNIIYAFSVDGK